MEMNKVCLNRDDLKNIVEFFDTFPDKEVIVITSDSSSGIGSIIKAHAIGVMVNGHIVTVTKDIVDERSW